MVTKQSSSAIKTLMGIATAAKWWSKEDFPSHFIDDDGNENNHWSGTWEEFKDYFGSRGLPESREMCLTLLSLSRCYGPTPLLGDSEAKDVMEYLWPKGNPCGLRLEWGALNAKLVEYINQKL